jgi:predicted transcriptional regulator
MANFDERPDQQESPKSEKDWGEIRKKLRRKIKNTDPTTAKIMRRAKSITEEMKKDDCSIKINPQVDAEGEHVLDKDKTCGLEAIEKMTEPETSTKSPENFDPSPPLDGRAGLLEQALAPETTPTGVQERTTNTINTTINTPLTENIPEISHATNSMNFPNQPSQTNSLNTRNQPSLFPRASTGENPELIDESLIVTDTGLGPDRSGLTLLRAIQTGALAATELDGDERRVVVKILRDQGRTQDEISALLQVSRRTIVSDYRMLRTQAAEFVRTLETYDIAGEIYESSQNAIQKALAGEKYRTVSQILRDMVEMLQSLGILYRAPTTSKVASIVGHVQSHQGYTKYMNTIGDEKEHVIDVLKSMMHHIETGEVN